MTDRDTHPLRASGDVPNDKPWPALVEAIQLIHRIRREGQWESAQTHTSLTSFLVEETWELIDAIDHGQSDELRSELGDLLLQVLFHCAIAAEHPTNPFDIDDVAGALLDKLRRRAPYWFTERGAANMSPEQQDQVWQQAKQSEKSTLSTRRVLAGISWQQPALALGQKVLERARSSGIPDDLVPESMRWAPVGPSEVFTGSGSAELSYRATVRRFADTLEWAESALGKSTATAQQWREVWPEYNHKL